MHVAYVTTDPGIPPFGTKGASIHVQSVLRVLLAMGHRVTLFSPCLAVAPAAEFATVALHPLPGAPRGDDAEARAAWALALNETVAAALTQAERSLIIGQLRDLRTAQAGNAPLSQAERVEIQRLLTARGFYRDEIDGKMGSGTMEAISAYQRAIGVAPDGYPTSILLGQLRRG